MNIRSIEKEEEQDVRQRKQEDGFQEQEVGVKKQEEGVLYRYKGEVAIPILGLMDDMLAVSDRGGGQRIYGRICPVWIKLI